MTADGRSTAWFGVGAVVLVHLCVAWVWLALDRGLPDGDVLGVIGAVEMFWARAHGVGAWAALAAVWTEDFGEYPALSYAVTGIASALLGVTDLDGDGPARVALLWGAIALSATGWLAWETSEGDGAASIWAAGLLASSPLWSATQRQVLIEDALCALVAVSAAACVAGQARSRLGLWALGGLAAGAALLTKQTAVLALVPLAAVLARKAWASRQWSGPATAAGIASLLAGPWYLRRLGDESTYAFAAAAANPDTVGPLHQLALYPLALVQQAWAPLLVLALAGALYRVRDRLPRDPLLIAALGLVLLVCIPKKYPRLLLPLLPFLAVAMGVALAQSRDRAIKGAVGALALGSLLAGSFVGRAGPLGATEFGLTGVDERCFQRWVEPPSRVGLPWEALIAEVERSGAAHVSAVSWPAPPCAHQTSHDLGEHLRVRLRRAGLRAEVLPSFVSGDGWAERPVLILSDGLLRCGEPVGAAGAGDPCEPGDWELVARLPYSSPTWTLDLRLYGPTR